MGANDRDENLTTDAGPWPPYAFVPGGPWPHPTRSPGGHSFGQAHATVPPVVGDDWPRSAAYLRGVALFNAGFYWEAHEVWESLWHAHGRTGPTADVIKALIKLAAAGVKVREGQPHGITTHARRAAELFAKARADAGPSLLGLGLDGYAAIALEIATAPPVDPGSRDARVTRVFAFRIEPRR